MCFNVTITWATAGLGFLVAGVAKAKNKPSNLYLPPAYFASMEVLQGLMYFQLDHPSFIFANILIYIAYIHVCFQPLVINYWLGSFIDKKRREVYLFTLKMSFIAGLLLLSRLYFSSVSPLCSGYETLCSSKPLIYYGVHHIVWSLPLVGAGWNYITPSIALHFFFFFMPGMVLGFYRLMLIFFIFGPYLATKITPNVSEQSSIWCVIGFWLLALTTYVCIKRPPKFLFPYTIKD